MGIVLGYISSGIKCSPSSDMPIKGGVQRQSIHHSFCVKIEMLHLNYLVSMVTNS
jgi:hypothetical protein